MIFAKFSRLVRAFVMGLALVGVGPVLAQRVKAPAKKAKAKPTEIIVTPGVSAPQVVLAAPVAAPAAASVEGLAGWVADLSVAQAQARATNRPILAVFSGSDWCKPCVVYEREVFSQPEFMAYAKNKLVLAHFDFPRQKKNQPSAAQLRLNAAATAQLNREGDFPLAVLVAPDGKVLVKTGYIAGGPAAFAAYLKTVVPNL